MRAAHCYGIEPHPKKEREVNKAKRREKEGPVYINRIHLKDFHVNCWLLFTFFSFFIYFFGWGVVLYATIVGLTALVLRILLSSRLAMKRENQTEGRTTEM